ncbi:hypothetical protein BGZ81_001617 [Podila clonocystis]|nr:hypothetical protein BGZ81_001617 [Podila clonocystis]
MDGNRSTRSFSRTSKFAVETRRRQRVPPSDPIVAELSSFEKQRIMLELPCLTDAQASRLLRGGNRLFDIAKTTAIVQEHLPDAVVDVDTATEITYVLPTASMCGRAAQDYNRDRKAALPGLFEHLDQEIASNQLGIKSVGLTSTTLEDVFISLQEKELTEKLTMEELEEEKGT